MQLLGSRLPASALRNSGFTLIEVALTLAILGVIMTSILVPLVSQITARNVSVTEKTLEQIKESLLGFAAANDRLPCPASAASNGVESFAAGGSVANGACETFYGFVPAVTLGVTPVDAQGYALDAWGLTQNRIRYAVSNQTINNGTTNVTNPFTSVNGMRSATIAQMATATLLNVCNSGVGVVAGTNCGTALALTTNAPVVIWSVGANAASGGGVSIDEAQNPNPGGGSADILFVSHPLSESAANPFDDIVTWLSLGVLTNRMIAAGQLP